MLVEDAASPNTASTLRAALQVDPEDFWQDWWEWAYAASVPRDAIALAGDFNAERALQHIAELAGPQYAGRQAGTAGAALAAVYVAERFGELGLEPKGDPIEGAAEPGFLRWTPITNPGA